MEECVFYIDELIVPEGYEVDILTIAEATSICGAYNLAMQKSEAKYKIYLHQDVFLLKKNLLQEMLDDWCGRNDKFAEKCKGSSGME